MLKRTSLLLVLPLILLSCASTGNQTNQPEGTLNGTSGLKKVSILAKGME